MIRHNAEIAQQQEAKEAAARQRLRDQGLDPEEEATRLRNERHEKFLEIQREAQSEFEEMKKGLTAPEEDENKRKERIQQQRNLPVIMDSEETYWRLMEQCYMENWLPVLAEFTFQSEQILVKTAWLRAINAAHGLYRSFTRDRSEERDVR